MTAEKKDRRPLRIKNLADLKRHIKLGTELVATAHQYHPDIVGLTRVVTKVQTNGFYSKIKDQPDHKWSTCNHGMGFWSPFNKANAYHFTDSTVQVLNTRKNDGSVLYEMELYDGRQSMSEQNKEVPDMNEWERLHRQAQRYKEAYDYSDTYNSTSGKNSRYFQNLPITAQFGIMMALMYGWHEGMTSPVPGTNNDDFAFATQCIIWEYQQQLRTSPTSIASNITIYGSIAQSESENISANVRWGKAQSAKEGNVPFHYKRFLGYRRGSDGKPEIDPEQAVVVKRIYERFLAGDSLATIANDLNTDGIPTPSGVGKWQRGTIESILTNEKYKGDAILNKTYIRDCLSKKVMINNGERPKYYVENNHPAIIDSATFGRVQEEMARRCGNAISQMHLGSQRQEKGCMALHQPT